MRKETMQWLVPVLLALGVAAALWLYWAATHREPAAEDAAPVEAAPPAEPAPQSGPVHPMREPAGMPDERPALRPLPPLDQSDDYFKLTLADLFGESLGPSLGESRLIERLVATVDNLPRAHVAQRMRPVTGVDGAFLVEEQAADAGTAGDTEEYRIDPENYARYDALVSMIRETDAESAAEVYRRFYPLLQKAYVNLGYPDGYFNDRVIEVIDELLATPDVGESPLLVRPNVLYEYADPALEKLSSGQKLLIRMGPGHRQIIKDKLREFRALIA